MAVEQEVVNTPVCYQLRRRRFPPSSSGGGREQIDESIVEVEILVDEVQAALESIGHLVKTGVDRRKVEEVDATVSRAEPDVLYVDRADILALVNFLAIGDRIYAFSTERPNSGR